MPRTFNGLYRSLTGGVGVGSAILTNAVTASPPPTLQRAVVVDIIVDPNILTSEYKQSLIEVVNNPDLIELMSVNTIIAKIVSGGEGVGPTSNTILFPFYSSHIMMPISPGEQVYVIYADFVGNGNMLGYWMTRVPGFGTIEDPNYMHYDRRFDRVNNSSTYSTREESERDVSTGPEDFPNGGNTVDTLTLPLPPSDSTENPYTQIFQQSPASIFVAPEPVPRWKKRPQELVLQGPNNALIMLGEDRNGDINGAIAENPKDITTTGGRPRCAGAIDIVAGRGRYLLEPGKNPRGGGDTTNPPGLNSTAPLVIENVRGFLETDKNPFRNRREDIANPNEGNPDPIYDAARVYIVQQSRADENYKLVPGDGSGIIYPVECIPNEQPEPVNGTQGRSYVINKADNIRIIARKEPIFKETPNIAGSILIIREGTQNTNSISVDPLNVPTTPNGDLAYVLLDKRGRIQIEAKEIYLGRSSTLNQPYIRYTVYKATIEELQNQINALRDHIGNLEQVLETAFQSAVAVPYANIPSLFALANNALRNQVQFEQLNQSITQSDDTVKNLYNFNVKSTKIFGE